MIVSIIPRKKAAISLVQLVLWGLTPLCGAYGDQIQLEGLHLNCFQCSIVKDEPCSVYLGDARGLYSCQEALLILLKETSQSDNLPTSNELIEYLHSSDALVSPGSSAITYQVLRVLFAHSGEHELDSSNVDFLIAHYASQVAELFKVESISDVLVSGFQRSTLLKEARFYDFRLALLPQLKQIRLGNLLDPYFILLPFEQAIDYLNRAGDALTGLNTRLSQEFALMAKDLVRCSKSYSDDTCEADQEVGYELLGYLNNYLAFAKVSGFIAGNAKFCELVELFALVAGSDMNMSGYSHSVGLIRQALDKSLSKQVEQNIVAPQGHFCAHVLAKTLKNVDPEIGSSRLRDSTASLLVTDLLSSEMSGPDSEDLRRLEESLKLSFWLVSEPIQLRQEILQEAQLRNPQVKVLVERFVPSRGTATRLYAVVISIFLIVPWALGFVYFRRANSAMGSCQNLLAMHSELNDLLRWFELKSGVGEADLKNRYRSLVKQVHPDVAEKTLSNNTGQDPKEFKLLSLRYRRALVLMRLLEEARNRKDVV